jgi:S1-C subfamily serine protease
MSDRNIEDKAQPVAQTAFDASKLFEEHRDSVVRLSDTAMLGPNKIENTLGSGFAIDSLDSANSEKDRVTCRIATDNHVVASPTPAALINMPDGTQYPFKVEARDPANDLAILKVDNVLKEHCQPLELTDAPTPVGKGDNVVKLGARSGDVAFTAGTVETYFKREDARGLRMLPGEDGKREMLSVTTKNNLAQGGDSGGPMFDTSGKVIAVMDAEGPYVIAGTPAHLLKKQLEKLQSND